MYIPGTHGRTEYIYKERLLASKKRDRKINKGEGAKVVTYLLLHFVYSVGARAQRIYLRQQSSVSGTETQID